MVSLPDLLFNKNLLDIIGVETPSGYSKKHVQKFSIMDSPLSVLSFKKLNSSYHNLISINEKMHDILAETKYVYHEDIIFDVWLKLYGLEDEASYFSFLHQNNNNNLIIGSHFADIVNYMFLTNRKHISQIDDSEWLINNHFLDLNKAQTPFNGLDSKDRFAYAINIMSMNYSISEIINIMFMDYESQYKLFIDEEVNVNSFLDTKIINNTTYQMLIIYYYNVLKQIKRADPKDCLRIKEFMDYDKRQMVYKNIYSLTFSGNPEMYYGFKNLNVMDVYNAIDFNIVNRISVLTESNIPADEWEEYINLPYEWIKNIVGKK